MAGLRLKSRHWQCFQIPSLPNGGPQLLSFAVCLAALQPNLENAVEGRPSAVVSLQGTVGLDLVVAQAAAPARTEDGDAVRSVMLVRWINERKEVRACSCLPQTTANRSPHMSIGRAVSGRLLRLSRNKH